MTFHLSPLLPPKETPGCHFLVTKRLLATLPRPCWPAHRHCLSRSSGPSCTCRQQLARAKAELAAARAALGTGGSRPQTAAVGHDEVWQAAMEELEARAMRAESEVTVAPSGPGVSITRQKAGAVAGGLGWRRGHCSASMSRTETREDVGIHGTHKPEPLTWRALAASFTASCASFPVSISHPMPSLSHHARERLCRFSMFPHHARERLCRSSMFPSSCTRASVVPPCPPESHMRDAMPGWLTSPLLSPLPVFSPLSHSKLPLPVAKSYTGNASM